MMLYPKKVVFSEYLIIMQKFKRALECWAAMRQEAERIAKKAGEYLLAHFRKDAALVRKRGLSKDIVTRYDHECDALIIQELKQAFPIHSILTEESGLYDRKSNFCWIVDSLDGTSNFAMGNPFFSVSIALVKGDQPLIGVVYAPFLDELYVAELGKGTTLNGTAITVSRISDIRGSYIVACEGGSKTNVRMADVFSKIYPDVKDMRKIGSAAIEGGMVAAGRADAYVTLDIFPWDVAASILLVTEAGGRVTDFSGNPWRPVQSDIIMSNGLLHPELLRRVKGESFM
jgi:myo-inositol-1(or 4)-monophosphatase